MKKQLIYSIIALFVATMTISCSNDDEQEKTLTLTETSWNYATPHFVFEYAKDSIEIAMGPMGKKSISVKELNKMFLDIAHSKMSAYFKGIDFVSASELKIRMQFADNSTESLKAAYINKDGMLEVSLDTADMNRVMKKAINIPKISFRYIIDKENMKLYFDKTYVQTIASMMMDQMLDMIVPMLIQGAPVPPQVLPIIKESLKGQINQIINDTRKLEIGMNMTQSK